MRPGWVRGETLIWRNIVKAWKHGMSFSNSDRHLSVSFKPCVLLPLKWKEWDMTVVLNHSSGPCSLLGWKSDLLESLTSLRCSRQIVKCPKYKKDPGCFAYPFLQSTVSVLTCKSSPDEETFVSVRICYVYGKEPDHIYTIHPLMS